MSRASTIADTRREALATGATLYRGGRPCPNGHAAPRYTSDSSCSECALRRAQARYVKLREPILQAARDRHRAAPEAKRAQAKAWGARNLERKRALRKEDYARNRDRYRSAAAEWQRANPARVNAGAKARRLRDPAAFLASATATRLAKHRRRPPWLTQEHKREIRNLYRLARRLTVETGLRHTVDHIVPLRGKRVSGLHGPWNLQVLTEFENKSKSNKFDQ
jgi:hypothetical protein